MIIYFDEDKRPDEKTENYMTKAALLCLQKEEMETENTSLSVTFVDKEEIKALNRDYRGVDAVTDVLSFPQYAEDEEIELSEDEELSLGDVVICSEKAKEQAEEFGHSYERELVYLFTHSVLHLLGYDHLEEEDKKLMRKREEEVMKTLGLERTAI